MAGIIPPCRLLDMGAGKGATVAYFRSLGFEAEGVDLAPRGAYVRQGDLLRLPYNDRTFGAVVSECVFELSGDRAGAFREAYRVLQKNGLLLVSDVCYTSPVSCAESAGFKIVGFEDRTEAWIRYYMECIWRGDETPSCENKKCRYYIMVCRKE